MSRQKGDFAEDKAIFYLQEHGFLVIDRNFSSRFGEIDIIAAKNGVVHFVEVKSGDSYELAIQNITRSKLGKLLKTGDVYMKKNGYDGDYEYDAVVVTVDEVLHVENITI